MTILQHPRSPVKFDSPPLAPEQVDYSGMSRDEQIRRCNAIDQVGILIEEFGVETVQRWIRYHAWQQGRRI